MRVDFWESAGRSVCLGGSDLGKEAGVEGAGPRGAGSDRGGREESGGEGYSHLNLRPAHKLQAVRREDVREVMHAKPCLTQ